jgi:hypothetical protein
VGRIAIVAALVLAIGAAGLLIFLRSSGGSARDTAKYHRYFLMGKRECAVMLQGLGPDPIGDITVWNGYESVEILHFGRAVPRQYRSAVRAGCEAG